MGKSGQHITHGLYRHLEQGQTVRPVCVNHKVGWAMLDMKPLSVA
jgi:hypothetical protein